MAPFSNTTTQLATRRAKLISCVTTIIVMPSCASFFITFSTSPTVSGSSADVGSSNSITSGSIASARAIATRCCCPPDRLAGKLPALAASPTFSSSAMARARAASGDMPSTVMGPIATLSSADLCGNSSKLWNTMPIRWRTRRTSDSDSGSATPSSRTRPPSSFSSALVQRSRVDLPEPDGPIKHITSPLFTCSDTSFSATKSP
ncbi:hypothetical protein D3C73_894230 [compost metagenome]